MSLGRLARVLGLDVMLRLFPLLPAVVMFVFDESTIIPNWGLLGTSITTSGFVLRLSNGNVGESA